MFPSWKFERLKAGMELEWHQEWTEELQELGEE